eukprot:4448080-Pyramimonas_sp.AAC.1
MAAVRAWPVLRRQDAVKEGRSACSTAGRLRDRPETFWLKSAREKKQYPLNISTHPQSVKLLQML